jgi:predicted pyridoxine 5'-phosphate oxidase superfamily flavin-nucleotide-binding protein
VERPNPVVVLRLHLSLRSVEAMTDHLQPPPGSPYHEGELAVQARAGVAEDAARVGRIVGGRLNPSTARFLAERELAVVGAADGRGRVWASPLAGPPGFLRPAAEDVVRVGVALSPADPLSAALAADGTAVGMLAIDLATRRRLRVNGLTRAVPAAEGGGFDIEAREIYGNCPQYIHAREPRRDRAVGAAAASAAVQESGALTADQRRWVEAADTLFIASLHPERGADASHRGGLPGFVRALDPSTLVFPDYAGNRMFNTLGNLAAHPAAGLLFLDFEDGSVLQASGEATIVWDAATVGSWPGAERAVRFRLTEVVERRRVLPLRWSLREISPTAPPARLEAP